MSLSQHPLDRAVVFAVDFRPRTVGGLSVMPNHGRAAGAPRWLQLGDGSTSTTFPTPLTGYGASFDVGDYLICDVIDRYDVGSKFWMYFYGGCTKSSGIIYGWHTRDATQTNARGIGLGTNGSVLSLAIAGASGIDQTTVSSSNRFQPRQVDSWAVNFKGGTSVASNFEYLLNGRSLGAGTTSTDTWTGDTIKSGKRMIWGKYWNGNTPAGDTIPGQWYALAFGDGLLTPRDISILDNLVRQGIK